VKVQFLDLASQYRKIRNEVLREIKTVCDSQHYVLGKNVSGLEAEVASYCGAKFAVGVASGTDALLLALMAAGVKAGDKVATSPFTFFATAGSIARLGAVPLFVDIDPDTYNIDPVKLEAALRKNGKKVKAIIPVHLYGQCADMAPIMKLGRKYRIPVIEDAAQSIGAAYKGKRAGSIGDMGCLSFYPTKNLGCFGDGGMVTTNDAALAQKVGSLRNHGLDSNAWNRYSSEANRLFYTMSAPGFNYGMFDLAYGYAREGMTAFVDLQEREFKAAEERGFTAIKHQREVGAGYFDTIATTVDPNTSTAALKGSTEEGQFH